MHIHYLQHVPFEDTGCIEAFLRDRDHKVSATRFFLDETLPAPKAIDGLIILGGPMSVTDVDDHPWLAAEKTFIRDVIDAGKWVLGICLGAQMIADVLGARVYKADYKEIGWFDIYRSQDAAQFGFADIFPQSIKTFHWHGDTFDLPAGAILLATSKACKNQGFIFNKRVVGLQFHMEVTPRAIEAMIGSGSAELQNAPYIQTADEIRLYGDLCPGNNQVMYKLLRYLQQRSD